MIKKVNQNFKTNYTTKDAEQDKDGGAYIKVEYNGITFKHYIFDKEGKLINFFGELKACIDNINEIKGVTNLEYITDNEGNGTFKFKYNNEEKTVKFEGKVLTAKDLGLENIKKNSIVITNQNNNSDLEKKQQETGSIG